jgi:hypothetical protein
MTDTLLRTIMLLSTLCALVFDGIHRPVCSSLVPTSSVKRFGTKEMSSSTKAVYRELGNVVSPECYNSSWT